MQDASRQSPDPLAQAARPEPRSPCLPLTVGSFVRDLLATLLVTCAFLTILVAEADADTSLSWAGGTQAGTPAVPLPFALAVQFSATQPVPVPGGAGVVSVTLDAGAGFRFGAGPGAASCSAAEVQSDETKCPLGSLAGDGLMIVWYGAQQQTVGIHAYNAPGGQQLNVLTTSFGPPLFSARAVIAGALDGSRSTLTLGWPAELTQPQPGVFAHLALLQLSMHTGGQVAGASEAWVHTVGCPRRADGSRGWDPTATLTSSDASTVQTGASLPCVGGPTVTTGPADSITRSSATLHGTLDGEGRTSSYAYQFQYGVTNQYGTTYPRTVFQALPTAGPLAIDGTITNLMPNTTYHYRLAMQWLPLPGPLAPYPYQGADETFTTQPIPPSTRVTGSPGVHSTRTGFLVSTGIAATCHSGPTCTAKLAATIPDARATSRRTLTVGSASILLKPASTTKLGFLLNRTGANRLRKRKHLVVALSVTVQAGTTTPAVATRRLYLRLPRRTSRSAT